MASTTNSKFLQTAKDDLDRIESAISTKLSSAVKSNSSTVNIDSSSALATFKSNVSVSAGLTGKKINIPEEVYVAFAKVINNAISAVDETFFDKYSANENKLVQQFANQVGTILSSIDDEKVPVKDKTTGKTTTYTISFSGSSIGVKGLASVSDGKDSSYLIYKNANTWKTALARFCISLYQLEHDLINNVWKSVANIFVSNAKELFKAIYGGTDSELKKVLGNSLFKKITRSEIKSQINGILSNYSDKKIAGYISSYENLRNLYDELEYLIANDQSVTSKATSFNTSGRTLANSLGVSFTALGDPTNDLKYSKNLTEVTIPSGYGNVLNSSDYDKKVKKIYATNFSPSVEITGNSNANIIYSGSGNDILRGGSGKDTIYGGNGNDSLYGDASNDKLFGEIGNDTLIGGKGNDTLSGGDGNDVFYYSAGDGNDIITDYTAGEDTIFIGNGVIKKASMNGNNAIFNFANNKKSFTSNGKITIQKGKNKRITFIDTFGNISTYLNGVIVSSEIDTSDEPVNYNGITVKLSSDAYGTFTLDEYNNDKSTSNKAINIDATASNASSNGYRNLTIYGNDSSNVIQSGKYYNHIYGGKGDDHLYSGDGSYSTYFYYTNGDGNDTIYNLKNGDNIQLTDCSVKNVSTVGSNIVINLDTGNTITLKNSFNKNIYITGLGTVSYAGTANNNFEERNDVEEHWFIEDNNFATDEISSILQDTTSDSIGKMATYDARTILTGKQSSLIAYSQNKK